MVIENGGNRGWTINNNVPGCDLSILPRCCALAKSTGKRCQRPAKKGQKFCGMHAGTCHPGRKKGATVPVKHGLYTEEMIQERKDVRDVLRALNGLIGVINQKTLRSKGSKFYEEIA